MFRSLRDQATKFQRRRFFQKARNLACPTVFTYHPEPIETGNYTRGLRWLSGEYFDDHQMHRLMGATIWDISPSSQLMLESFHKFEWMDDLANVNTAQSDKLIKSWMSDWIERYRFGAGPGWQIDAASWRLMRMLSHSTRILKNLEAPSQALFFETLAIHFEFIQRFQNHRANDLVDVLSTSAMLFAGVTLSQYEREIESLRDALDACASKLLTPTGIKLNSRNPEELARIFELLVWAKAALSEREVAHGSSHEAAIAQLGRALRTLRHGAGRLLEAHGGSSEGFTSLERALSQAGVRGAAHEQPILGFAHIKHGQLSAIVDIDEPPAESFRACASTGAIWIAEGSQKLIGGIGCAKYQRFQTRVGAQTTHAHSTLIVNNSSSSKLEIPKTKSTESLQGAIIGEGAKILDAEVDAQEESTLVSICHDGYLAEYGITHERKISVERDGRYFAGVDILNAPTPKHQKRLKNWISASHTKGLPFEIRFVLGPKITPSLDMNKQAVSFKTQGGTTWVMRQTGASVEISDQAHYEVERINPIPAKTIILRSRLVDTSGYISWSFQAYYP